MTMERRSETATRQTATANAAGGNAAAAARATTRDAAMRRRMAADEMQMHGQMTNAGGGGGGGCQAKAKGGPVRCSERRWPVRSVGIDGASGGDGRQTAAGGGGGPAAAGKQPAGVRAAAAMAGGKCGDGKADGPAGAECVCAKPGDGPDGQDGTGPATGPAGPETGPTGEPKRPDGGEEQRRANAGANALAKPKAARQCPVPGPARKIMRQCKRRARAMRD